MPVIDELERLKEKAEARRQEKERKDNFLALGIGFIVLAGLLAYFMK